MDFSYTEEQQMLLDTTRRFIAERLGFEARQHIRATASGYSQEAWQQLGELGLLALNIPEADGGMGAGAIETMLVCNAAGEGLLLEPYLSSAVYAVTTRESTRIGSWQDIDSAGTVVAVAAGTLMEPLLRQTLKQAELLVVRPPRTREAEVQSGRADVFMSDFPYTRRMVLMHDWARVIDPPGRFGDTLYGYAVARGDTAWLTEVNAFVTAAKADGTLARAAARHGLSTILVY